MKEVPTSCWCPELQALDLDLVMEVEPPLYPVAGAAGPQGDEDRHGVPDGPEAPLDELVGAYPNYNEEEEERRYYRRKRLGVVKNVLAASTGVTLTYGVYLGLLQMQLILHYDETYREVKYGNMGLPDIDSKMLMGINVTPIAALLYTPVLIRFFGTKWMMFLAVGIYALFVSTNYWERYYTLVPSAVALGMAIVPLWASMGNYITRMSQKYYEYSHYKEQDEQGPQQRPPRGSHAPYLLVFQAIFYSFFHLSFACAQLPMIYFVAALWGVGSALNKTGLSTLLGILYEDKERQDFIFTIYHWWQAVAIFVVYLGSSLPMKAKLAVLLVTLVAAAASYLWMEQKLQQGLVPRQPRIPKPGVTWNFLQGDKGHSPKPLFLFTEYASA